VGGGKDLYLYKLMRQADHTVLSVASQPLREKQLTFLEFWILTTLCQRGKLRVSDLAREAMTSGPNATRIIKFLKRRDLVTKRRNPRDDRETLISVTRKGRSLFDKVYPEWHQAIKTFFDSRLGRRKQDELLKLLEHFNPHT